MLKDDIENFLKKKIELILYDIHEEIKKNFKQMNKHFFFKFLYKMNKNFNCEFC